MRERARCVAFGGISKGWRALPTPASNLSHREVRSLSCWKCVFPVPRGSQGPGYGFGKSKLLEEGEQMGSLSACLCPLGWAPEGQSPRKRGAGRWPEARDFGRRSCGLWGQLEGGVQSSFAGKSAVRAPCRAVGRFLPSTRRGAAGVLVLGTMPTICFLVTLSES